jgi:hypothetical protein
MQLELVQNQRKRKSHKRETRAAKVRKEINETSIALLERNTFLLNLRFS